MAKKEFKGTTFLSISKEQLVPSVELCCNIYVFLPKNERMVRIREMYQSLDEGLIATYLSRPDVELFILDPELNVSSYNLNVAQNPRIAPEIIEAARKAWESEHGKLEEASSREFAEGNVLSKDQSTGTDSNPETRISNDSEIAIPEQTLNSNLSAEEPTQEFKAAPSALEPEQTFKADLAEVEPTQTFGSEAAQASSQLVSGSAQGLEPEQKFSGDSSTTSQQTLHSTAASEEATLRFEAAKKESVVDVKQTFSAAKREEDSDKVVRTFKKEEEKFRDAPEVITFKAKDGESEAPSTWVNRTNEKSSSSIQNEIEELENELKLNSSPGQGGAASDASSELAQSINKHLGKLRGEVASTVGIVPKTAEEAAELSARRSALKEEISKHEGTAAILEILDGARELPPSLENKTKRELVQKLEKNLMEVGGSAIASEAGVRAVREKIRSLRAVDPEIGEPLAQERLREELQAFNLGTASAEAVANLERKIVKESQIAAQSASVARVLTGTRKDLNALLDVKAKGSAKQAELAVSAAKLKEEIRQFEGMQRKLENGEELTDAEQALLPSRAFTIPSMQPGEDPKSGLHRMVGELGQLEGSAAIQKKEALLAEQQLKAKILGGVKEVVPPTEAELKIATHVKGLDLAASKIVELQQNQNPTPEVVAQVRSEVLEELKRAELVMGLEQELAKEQFALGELLRSAGKDGSKEVEAQALLIQKDIHNLQELRNDVQAGKPVNQARLDAVGELPKSLSVAPKSIKEMKARVELLKTQAGNVSAQASRTEQDLSFQVASLGTQDLKKNAVNVSALSEVEKKLSRHIKEFLETGKNPSNDQIWEINHSVTQTVQATMAKESIATQIVTLAKQHENYVLNGQAEEAKEVKAEVLRLQTLARAVDRGEPMNSAALMPFVAAVPEVFTINADSPPEKEMQRILESVGGVKTAFIEKMVQASEASVLAINPGIPPEPIKEVVEVYEGGKRDHREDAAVELVAGKAVEAAQNVVRIVSDAEDQRDLQAGIYAATLLRAYGYNDPQLEEDIITVSLIGRCEEENVRASFPERIVELRAISQGKVITEEHFTRDLKEIFKISFAYVDRPGVVTGTYAFHPEVFSEFCTELTSNFDDEMDYQMLERARQQVVFGISANAREDLIALAKDTNKKIVDWKLGKPA